MPYETVQEKVIQTRRIRVCGRCRNPIPEHQGAANRQQTIQAVSTTSASLATSLGGSILVGSLLGPVGAIGGAIVGSIAGARAGHEVGQKVSEAVVESNQDSLCESCRKIVDSYENRGGGGHRLGSAGDDESSSTGERIGEVASAAGRNISNGLSWMKQSVTNLVDNAKNSGGTSNKNNHNNNSSYGGNK